MQAEDVSWCGSPYLTQPRYNVIIGTTAVVAPACMAWRPRDGASRVLTEPVVLKTASMSIRVVSNVITEWDSVVSLGQCSSTIGLTPAQGRSRMERGFDQGAPS